MGSSGRGPRASQTAQLWGFARSAAGTRLASYLDMVAEPEVILTGSIAHIADGYLWLDRGARVVVLPRFDVRPLRVGMLITVRAVRRHGQFIAKAITAEPAPR